MTRYLLQLALCLCIAWPAPTYGQDSSKAGALYSLVVDIMQSTDGLLPVFEHTTVAGMREQLFGEAERDPEFKESWYLNEWEPGTWSSSWGLHTNFDYMRFIELPAELEVTYSSRQACPADPYLETGQFVSIIQGHSVPYLMAEMFAYYYYLEHALSASMGSDNPLNMTRREKMLAQAEKLLAADWQNYSYDETWDAFEEFRNFFETEVLNFSHNEYAFEMAESGSPATFVYLETWECGGYEGNWYTIGASSSGSEILIISDLDYEICRALDFDPWSPDECLAWQPFPNEDMFAVGWFRVLSFGDQGTVRRGSIRPQLVAFENRDWSQPLVIPIDSALR